MSILIHMNGDETIENVSPKTFGTLQHTWKTQGGDIQLYGKKRGRPGMETKYDFPPPMHTTIFYGECLLVTPNGELTLEQWRELENPSLELEADDEILDYTYSKELEEEPYKIDLNRYNEST